MLLPTPVRCQRSGTNSSDLSQNQTSMACITSENVAEIEKYHSDRIALLFTELERLQIRVDRHSEIIEPKAEPANEDDLPDPENEKSMWNLNSISVLMWKSWFWPKNQRWNHDKEQFEDLPFVHHETFRSYSQILVESIVGPFLFTFVPLVLVFIEMCILAGVMDQGSNQKSHIYGDGYYQSLPWRFSGEAYLRASFVPVLDSNGVQIGMTSGVDSTNHSMLRDRPESEATKCLEMDYLMPFSKYKVQASPATGNPPPSNPSSPPAPCIAPIPRVRPHSPPPSSPPHPSPRSRPPRSPPSSPPSPPSSPPRTTPPRPRCGASWRRSARGPTPPGPSPTACPGSTPPSAPPSGAPARGTRRGRPRARTRGGRRSASRPTSTAGSR
jgi:hypothetical protein